MFVLLVLFARTLETPLVVILGFINDKTTEGKYRVKNGVHVMSGRRFLQYIFKGDEGKIIRYLRRAVRTMCC